MKKSITNFLLSQICWFCCVLGGAHGLLWLGPIASLLLAAMVVWSSDQKRQESFFLAVAVLLGSAGDRLVVGIGAYNFSQPFWSPWGYPVWMSGLWLAFAATFGYSLNGLSKKYGSAAIFGAVGGPLAYSAGAKLGAISVGEPSWQAWTTIGLYWSVVLPSLFGIRNKLLACKKP